MPNFLEQLTKTGALNVVNPMESYQKALKTKGLQTDIRTAELDQETKVLELGREYLSRVQNQDEYQNYRTYMTDKLGVDPSLLPESFESDEDFKSWRETAIYGVEELSKLRKGQEAEFTIRRPDGSTSNVKMTQEQLQKNIDAGLVDKENVMVGKLSKESFEREAARKKAVKTAELEAKAEVETEPEFGEPYVDERTGALLQKSEKTGQITKVASPPKGWTIESDGEGGFRMVMGGGADMAVKTKGTIEEKMRGGLESYNRMQTIAKEFKPEYQEIGTRLSTAWTGLKAKAGADISKEDEQQLTDFKSYQRKSIENINLYIKEMTGAQMSEKEADRLRLAQPDPGEQWWKGDDPITFRAKMDDVIKYSRAAVARYNYYKNKGLGDSEIQDLISSGEAASLDDLVAGMK